ncbi:polysaccharide chain length determinant protein, PEP-CTERM locus subfamily [Oceanospirillum multiglobuliferum]|uniref:Tyrosine-protein kinase G-rich domain-containing protein n=1 Tax=Oceanospirillum multiglobuliferum TaxID=64969 RepID=A0A1T4PTS5_9GAMM|nr:GNVR domain-containing protein [Oceanospirillum multiglobuliferum]OPX55329.1 hypothetical protein BTE48_09175 [Oceanospirillum multiglobuliferum]SJZ94716.1 polysaccharide chain length determinant protein, PEP-CTERM locus subfamily [Oceanospirillum multiglobuliferum]
MKLAVQARFYQILSAAWRHRYMIVLPPLVMPFIGLAIGMMSAKVYDSHTSFLIQESAKLNPFLEDLSVQTQIQQRIKALETLLHSRHILQQVAEDQSLLSTEASDQERERVIRRLSGQLKVSLHGSDLISLHYRSRQQAGMDKMLLQVREVFIDQLLAPERSSVSNSEQFLLAQIERQRKLLDQSEAALSNFRSQHALQLPSLLNANISELGSIKQLIAEKSVDLAGQKAALESLHTHLIRTNPIVGALEKQMIDLRSELVSLQARYTDRHSKVMTLQNKLHQLELEHRELQQLTEQVDSLDALERLWQASAQGEILTGLKGVEQPNNSSLIFQQVDEIENARARYMRLQTELTQLQQQQQEMLNLIQSSGDIEQNLLRLSRDLDVQKKVYQELLDRYERAKITGALGAYEQPNRIKVIDEPFIPGAPSNLPTLIFVMAGCVAGLAIGVGIALLKELTDSRLRYVQAVQAIAGVPVLARLPKVTESSYVLDLSGLDLDSSLSSDSDPSSPPVLEGELQ